MSITDELRAYVRSHSWKSLTAIADRIDAEYQKAEDEWKANGGKSWLHGYEECHLELMEGNEVIAASLEEAGWYRVLDADKQPIRIGDELDGYGYPYGGSYCKAIVNETMILVGEKDSSYTTWLMWDARSVRHHHETTVEDVLQEFALEIDPSADIAVTGAETIKKFAAKLQLKEPSE